MAADMTARQYMATQMAAGFAASGKHISAADLLEVTDRLIAELNKPMK
jgi:hypothetical protein